MADLETLLDTGLQDTTWERLAEDVVHVIAMAVNAARTLITLYFASHVVWRPLASTCSASDAIGTAGVFFQGMIIAPGSQRHAAAEPRRLHLPLIDGHALLVEHAVCVLPQLLDNTPVHP